MRLPCLRITHTVICFDKAGSARLKCLVTTGISSEIHNLKMKEWTLSDCYELVTLKVPEVLLHLMFVSIMTVVSLNCTSLPVKCGRNQPSQIDQ